MGDADVGRPCHILVLCTANQARSPALARLLRHEASNRERGSGVQICDAGIEAAPGAPLLDTMEAVLLRHGMSVDHRSQQLEEIEAEVELVLTMTETQRRWVLQRHRRLLARVFTVRELCRLVGSAAWPSEPPALSNVGPTAHQLRPMVPAGGVEDIADPAGRPQAVAEQIFDELRECSRVLGPVLFGQVSRAPR